MLTFHLLNLNLFNLNTIPHLYRVSQKKLTFVWGAVAPLNFKLGLKVEGVLESSGSQL